MKSLLKSLGWMLAGGLLIIPVRMLGARFYPAAWARSAFWCCFAALIALYVIATVQMFRGLKNREPDVVGDRDEAMRRQAELERDYVPEQKAIMKMERGIWQLWSMLIALHVLTALLQGAAFGFSGDAPIVFGVVCMYTFGPLLEFALCSPRLIEMKEGTELCEAEYPHLFRLVREAAKEIGYKRRIRLFLGGPGVGVFRDRRFDGMFLPALLVSFMTKDELHQALLHEFAHLCREELDQEFDWLVLTARASKVLNDTPQLVFGLFPLMPRLTAFRTRVTEYRTLIGRRLEQDADERLPGGEQARAAVAAIAKSAIFLRFNEEDRVSTYRCYAAEEPRREQLTLRGEIFREMLAQRGKVWLEELESEKSAQFDTHPTFSQRREALGVKEFSAFAEETDGAWLEEMKKLCDQDAECLAMDPEYSVLHEKYYVQRRKDMEAYDRCADPMNELESQALIDAAEAYFGLDTPKAMGIVREILSRQPKNLEAKLLLGLWLLDARDDGGLEFLYEVAGNGNYAERALTEAGEYVFRRGNDDRIAEYRTRSAYLLQEAAEFHYRLGEVRLSDLKPRSMAPELLDELVNEMVRRGGGLIEAIGCAAKEYDRREDAHVFVLKFVRDGDEEACEAAYNRIFDLLDERDENYALRMDSDISLKWLERQAPGSVVYQKREEN